MLDSAAPRRVRVGSFELDVDSGELRNNEHRQVLPEQPLALLKALIARPGGLVTRDELRRELWPEDTFVDFEHGLNAAVKRLRDVLGDSADAPQFIETVPRRGYRLVAPVEGHGLGQPTTAPHPLQSVLRPIPSPWARRPPRWWFLAGAALTLAGSSAIWWQWRAVDSAARPEAEESLRVVPLTSLPGWVTAPSFSPDGTEVAFEWAPKAEGNSGIYVSVVGSPNLRQITSELSNDHTQSPSWSPDGRRIAFLTYHTGDHPEGGRIHITSALGGPDVKVSDFPGWGASSWSPDGRYIAVAHNAWESKPVDKSTGIYLVPAGGGEVRQVTRTTLPAFDFAPSFSPDGRELAYVSCVRIHYGGCDLYVVGLDSAAMPNGTRRRLTRQAFYFIPTLTWSRNGTSVIYEAQAGGWVNYLWRVAADGSGHEERLEIAGLGARQPAVARNHDLLAFSREADDVDVYRFDWKHAAQPVLVSTFSDFQPHLSNDGQRVAFCSERSGEGIEIWTAHPDGADAHPILHGPNKWWQGSPSWSPDDRQILFNSQGPDGNWHVWIVDAEGGTPRQITTGAGNEGMPTWSRDGQWIYFSAERGPTKNIWRVRASGGPWEQVTTDGGTFGLETVDGNAVIFQTSEENSPVYVKAIANATIRQLVPCARPSDFASTREGVFYVACDNSPNPALHLIDLAGTDRILGSLESYEMAAPSGGLAVAPDGKSVLYARHVGGNANLMLIENFK